jgi:hypothetical protein
MSDSITQPQRRGERDPTRTLSLNMPV